MPILIALALLALPVAEIAVFIVVGSNVGVLATIGLIFAASAAGALLLRTQGLGNLARLRAAMDRGETPAMEVADGAMILLAGLLLITPGFITGSLGLLLFIPPVRRFLWRWIGANIAVVVKRRRGSPNVVDLDPDEFSRDYPRRIDRD